MHGQPHVRYILNILNMVYILRFFLSLQNAVCFIILTYLVPVLFTFYTLDVLKLKKYYSSAKRLISILLLAPVIPLLLIFNSTVQNNSLITVTFQACTLYNSNHTRVLI